MTAAPTGTNDARRVRRALVAAVLLGAALAAIVLSLGSMLKTNFYDAIAAMF